MARVCKEAGRPLPRFSPDDVLDYMVVEAISCAVWQDNEKQEKKRKKAEWKKRPVGSGH